MLAKSLIINNFFWKSSFTIVSSNSYTVQLKQVSQSVCSYTGFGLSKFHCMILVVYTMFSFNNFHYKSIDVWVILDDNKLLDVRDVLAIDILEVLRYH